MEETQTDTVQNESRNKSVSSSSSDGALKFKRMHSDRHLADSGGAQRVSQALWSTGNLYEPIPSGFYSILPVRCPNSH